MKRLTKRNKIINNDFVLNNCDIYEVVDKLGQLEDIEEKLENLKSAEWRKSVDGN